MESRWKKIMGPASKKTARDQRRGSRIETTPVQKGMPEMIKILPLENTGQDAPSEDRPIDTNLIVGPFYDNSKRQKTAIKEQLSDITKRLHQTLYTFDALETFEESPKADIVDKVRRKINNMETGETKDQFASFLVEYEDMTSNVAEANQERDELLLQLADWFTTDHVDLDDVKTTLDQNEEADMSEGYTAAMVQFETLKKLQNRIESGAARAQELRILEEEKKKVEKQVITNMKLIKTKSIHNTKKKTGDDSAWKYAADEIVGMLKKVRMEGSEEIEMLTSRVRELLDELEKQQWTIRSLNSEVRREKSVKNQLSDENTDLKVQIGQLNDIIKKNEKDLDMSRKMIEKQFEELSKRRKSYDDDDDDDEDDDEEEDDEEPKKTVSKLMEQVMGEEASLREMPSEPYILRSRIRQQGENIMDLTKQLQEMEGRLIDFERVIEAKNAVIDDIQGENDDFVRKVTFLEAEIQRRDAEPPAPAPKLSRLTVKSTESCQKCKERLLQGTGDSSLDIQQQELLHSKDEEIERLTKSVQYFKRLLSEAEMKLSEAYKDISDLRMATDSLVPEQVPKKESFIRPEVEPDVEEEIELIVEEQIPEPADTEQKDEDLLEVDTAIDSGVKRDAKSPLPTPKPPPKPKREYRDRVTLPPLVQQPTRFSRKPMAKVEEDDDVKTKRQQTLYEVGDLQSKLNIITQMIMDYVSTVGNMIFKDKNDQNKLQSLRTFEFGQESKQKKDVDNKDMEGKQKKSQAFMNGQQACALLREVYELLSSSLKLQHSEFETIYRSFKNNQRRYALQREAFAGQMAVGGLFTDNGLQSQEGFSSRGFSQREDEGQDFGAYPRRTGIKSEISPWEKSEFAPAIIGEEMGQRDFNGAPLVHGLHRSKSELDIHSTVSNDSLTAQILRERSQVFLTNIPDHVRDRKTVNTANREEVSVAKTTVPKKGLIKLTSLQQELKNPLLFEKSDSGKEVLPMEEVREKQRKQQISQAQQKMLIKRKDILNQVKLGSKKLMQEEEKQHLMEDIDSQIQNYTLRDIHNNLDMYSATHGRRASEVNTKESEVHVQQRTETPVHVIPKEMDKSKRTVKSPDPQQQKKNQQSRESKKRELVALPAINMLNPFGS